MLSPIARESLQEWVEDMGDAMVIAAMKLAVKNGGQTFSYLEKILQEWSRAKLETVEQLKVYQQRKEQHRARGSSPRAKADQKGAVFAKLRKGSAHEER
ncbi:DnaD domain-containing protein [Gracilibacillus dipsosauri]|uniref:DnaD domain-containing protein n=1 Tax=Gracilibacillus dipsosauri TaxID=178340 RepID=UPI002408F5B4